MSNNLSVVDFYFKKNTNNFIIEFNNGCQLVVPVSKLIQEPNNSVFIVDRVIHCGAWAKEPK